MSDIPTPIGGYMGNLDPPPVAHWTHLPWRTHSLGAACNLKIETQVSWYRKQSPGAPQCLLCGPDTQFHVHITAPGGRCFSGLQLALLPPQPSASTSAKAGMKEAFQRKQAAPVTPDKRLQWVVKLAELLALPRALFLQPLPAMCVLLTLLPLADNTQGTLSCSWWKVKMTSRHLEALG